MSYSHAVDGKLAPALQSGLHQLAKPFYRLRALHVFRDKSSLSATPELWPTIQAAMSDSRFFILLASPESAASKWVNREIEAWRATNPVDRILLALTGGELRWDHGLGDFEWPRSTALPEQLRGAFSTEPLYVDFRWARSDEHLSLRHARFRDLVADLAAPLHGQPKEDRRARMCGSIEGDAAGPAWSSRSSRFSWSLRPRRP